MVSKIIRVLGALASMALIGFSWYILGAMLQQGIPPDENESRFLGALELMGIVGLILSCVGKNKK